LTTAEQAYRSDGNASGDVVTPKTSAIETSGGGNDSPRLADKTDDFVCGSVQLVFSYARLSDNVQ